MFWSRRMRHPITPRFPLIVSVMNALVTIHLLNAVAQLLAADYYPCLIYIMDTFLSQNIYAFFYFYRAFHLYFKHCLTQEQLMRCRVPLLRLAGIPNGNGNLDGNDTGTGTGKASAAAAPTNGHANGRSIVIQIGGTGSGTARGAAPAGSAETGPLTPWQYNAQKQQQQQTAATGNGVPTVSADITPRQKNNFITGGGGGGGLAAPGVGRVGSSVWGSTPRGGPISSASPPQLAAPAPVPVPVPVASPAAGFGMLAQDENYVSFVRGRQRVRVTVRPVTPVLEGDGSDEVDTIDLNTAAPITAAQAREQQLEMLETLDAAEAEEEAGRLVTIPRDAGDHFEHISYAYDREHNRAQLLRAQQNTHTSPAASAVVAAPNAAHGASAPPLPNGVPAAAGPAPPSPGSDSSPPALEAPPKPLRMTMRTTEAIDRSLELPTNSSWYVENRWLLEWQFGVKLFIGYLLLLGIRVFMFVWDYPSLRPMSDSSTRITVSSSLCPTTDNANTVLLFVYTTGLILFVWKLRSFDDGFSIKTELRNVGLISFLMRVLSLLFTDVAATFFLAFFYLLFIWVLNTLIPLKMSYTTRPRLQYIITKELIDPDGNVIGALPPPLPSASTFGGGAPIPVEPVPDSAATPATGPTVAPDTGRNRLAHAPSTTDVAAGGGGGGSGANGGGGDGGADNIPRPATNGSLSSRVGASPLLPAHPPLMGRQRTDEIKSPYEAGSNPMATAGAAGGIGSAPGTSGASDGTNSFATTTGSAGSHKSATATDGSIPPLIPGLPKLDSKEDSYPSLKEILSQEAQLLQFEQYLTREFAVQPLLFWSDVNTFRWTADQALTASGANSADSSLGATAAGSGVGGGAGGIPTPAHGKIGDAKTRESGTAGSTAAGGAGGGGTPPAASTALPSDPALRTAYEQIFHLARSVFDKYFAERAPLREVGDILPPTVLSGFRAVFAPPITASVEPGTTGSSSALNSRSAAGLPLPAPAPAPAGRLPPLVAAPQPPSIPRGGAGGVSISGSSNNGSSPPGGGGGGGGFLPPVLVRIEPTFFDPAQSIMFDHLAETAYPRYIEHAMEMDARAKKKVWTG